MQGNRVYNFVYSVLRYFALILCVSEISAALDEDNMLTVNGATDPDLQNWNSYNPDNVRCYCNLPVCVATGYMCKSETGGCFSEVVDPEQSSSRAGTQDVYKARHGCIELLQDKSQRSECRNMPNGKGSSKVHPRSLLLCCSKDLCNHVDSPETQTMLNGTLLGPMLNENPSQSSMSQYELNMSASPGYNSNEVWFKAAIIAVPICGTVILFVLIVLAVKILRTDSLNSSSKLGGHYTHGMDRESNRDHFDHVHHQASMNMKKVPLLTHHHHDMMSGACTNHSTDEIMKHTSVPLLLQNETGVSHSYDKKNEANAKLNTAHGHEYNLISNKEISSPIAVLQKPTNVTTSSNNIYKNVNLSVTPTPETLHQNTTEKLYDKQALSAVVSWGTTNNSCPV